MLRIGQVEPTAQNNLYTDGNVAGGIAATRLRAAAFNAIQEELAHIVETTGVSLSVSDTTQVLTALQKLLLTRANPFADIKSDGAAAIATALANLGLGTAAQRAVGIGTNQIPDMGYFQTLQSASGYQKLPGGLVIQWGPIPAINANSSALISYQIPFPNSLLGYAVAPGASATGVPGVGLQSVDKTQFRAYNQSTSTQTQAGTFVAVGY
ncbi:hypothetical protein TUM17576_46010 [Enterobacter hormaechei]|nr:hypothetical protein [Enterobacter hormaechei]GJL37781.1 hypothetical protein TUM17576_46010 [Enterobacter hormaechei]